MLTGDGGTAGDVCVAVHGGRAVHGGGGLLQRRLAPTAMQRRGSADNARVDRCAVRAGDFLWWAEGEGVLGCLHLGRGPGQMDAMQPSAAMSVRI